MIRLDELGRTDSSSDNIFVCVETLPIHRYLIYTRYRICMSKVKPKISAVSSDNNGRRPYWSFPLIKKMSKKTLYFSDLCIKYFLAA